MSKSITGKGYEVNFNITQAGTFNADVFNAYDDFTLNGSSIVNRIITNEENIDDLQTDKQDKLTIQQTITPSSTAIASATAIINYVGSVTPSITATAPLVYSGSNISGTFDNVATSGSNNFLNSGKIYSALATKQNNLTIQQSITASTTAIASATAIINYVGSAIPNITASSPFVYSGNNLTADFDAVATGGSDNLMTSSAIFLGLAGKQDTLTIQQTLTPSGVGSVVASADAIISALSTKQNTITSSTNLVLNNIQSSSGTITGATIVQGTTNLLSAIQSNSAQIATKQNTITSSTFLNTGGVNINGDLNTTGYIYATNDIISTTTVASPIILQGTTNLLTAINTKQSTITSTSAIALQDLTASGNIIVSTPSGTISSDTGSFLIESNTGGGTFNYLTVNNAITSTGTFVTTSGNIITQTGYIKATNGDITTTNGNITATNGNIVVANGDITASTGDIVATTGTIQGAVITGDIFGNLDAGQGVTLLQNTPLGKTRISVDAFTTSTEYAFQITSNITPPNHIIATNVVLPFNVIQFCKPNNNAYNTTNYSYTIQSAGVYSFGFKLFVGSNPETWRVGIYNGSTLIGAGGAQSYVGEAITVVVDCNIGDVIKVKCQSGSGNVYMGPNHSWFWGYKLQPVNNSIGASTDLSLANLTSWSVSTTTVNANTITGNIAGNLTAGNNIDLSTTSNITTIAMKTRFITASRSTNILPGSLTAYPYPYNIILYTQGGGFALNTTTGGITVSNAGYYSISATATINNASYTDRVNFRARLRINGSWSTGLPQGYSYARHSNYVKFATSTIPETIILLGAGDVIDIGCDVGKANNTSFTSDFVGMQFYNGGVITIRQV